MKKNPKSGPYKYFSYPKVREEQDRFVEEMDGFLSGDNKIMLLQGDTGLGKEVGIASQIAKHRRKFDHVIYCIPTDLGKINIEKELKLIQRQNPGMNFSFVTLYNKETMCSLIKSLQKKYKKEKINIYDLCDKRGCKIYRDGECEYYKLREKIKNYKIILCDYNYVFNPYIRRTVFKEVFKNKKILLIINECHELPERVKDQFSSKIGSNIFEQCINELEGTHLKKKHKEKFKRDFRGIKDVVSFLKKQKKHMRSLIIRKNGEFIKTVDNKIEMTAKNIIVNLKIGDRLINLGRDIIKWKLRNKVGASSHIATLGRFIQGAGFGKDFDYYLFYIEKKKENKYGLGMACLNPYPMIKEPFEKINKLIMYSGTMYPERYMRLFFLSKFGEVFLPNPYKSAALKNRTDLFYKDGKLDKKTRESASIKKSAKELEQILKKIPKPCAVFSVMALWRRMRDHINLGRLKVVEEGSKNKREFLKKILKSDVTVLTPYGSFTKSIDMSQLASCVVLGMPDPLLDLVTTKTIDYYKIRFVREAGIHAQSVSYRIICRLPAIEKSLQSVGRGIRTPKDRLLAIFFDQRWPQYSKFVHGSNKKEFKRINKLIEEIKTYKK